MAIRELSLKTGRTDMRAAIDRMRRLTVRAASNSVSYYSPLERSCAETVNPDAAWRGILRDEPTGDRHVTT